MDRCTKGSEGGERWRGGWERGEERGVKERERETF